LFEWATKGTPPPTPPLPAEPWDFETAWEEERNKCMGAPYPLVFGDGGKIEKLARVAYLKAKAEGVQKVDDVMYMVRGPLAIEYMAHTWLLTT
jgi:hypothetical protein